MMCWRAARVLSAHFTLARYVSIAAPKVLMVRTRRLSRCFSSAGDMPWRTDLRAFKSSSRAMASGYAALAVPADRQSLAASVETVVVAEGDGICGRYVTYIPFRSETL